MKPTINNGLITANGATMWEIVRAWVAWAWKKRRQKSS
jgi:hypothetical protein